MLLRPHPHSAQTTRSYSGSPAGGEEGRGCPCRRDRQHRVCRWCCICDSESISSPAYLGVQGHKLLPDLKLKVRIFFFLTKKVKCSKGWHEAPRPLQVNQPLRAHRVDRKCTQVPAIHRPAPTCFWCPPRPRWDSALPRSRGRCALWSREGNSSLLG